MQRIDTSIKGLYILEPKVFADHRGWFVESYNRDTFAALGIHTVFVQDNHSTSVKGVLRGLHLQLQPKSMAKLVRCIRGTIWDVAVDMRQESSTYLQWQAVELSAENKKMFYIPEGFLHGFFALEECEVLYKCSSTFDPTLDAGVIWNDPKINIQWPIQDPHSIILSQKDAHLPIVQDFKMI